MKTKNIFKTVALAMLMPAMLLTTACSSDDDVVVNNETTNKKGYPLQVTVNVTREDGATRAEYNESTRKLEFSAYDKLFVEGSHEDADRFAGTLDYVPATGKFSGTIYTESLYEGTIDDLLNGNYATLLPAGYGSYEYLEISDDGYQAHLEESTWKSFATSKAAGVEQLSFEHGEYTSGTGFVLEPRNAILNFTITGLTASTNVTATLSDDVDWTPDIEGEVTTDGSGNATFAIGLEGSSDLNEFSLTVAGNAITLVSSSKVLTAGKIYNITRSAAPAPAATDLSTINANYTASDGETLTGTLASNVKVSIADGATVTLDGVTINGVNNDSYVWAGITCLGDATIILSGTNTVKGFKGDYPGIQAAAGKTLIINGTGSLAASSYGWGAGIGAGSGSGLACGNIEIQGGTITATSVEYGAGIGGGNNSSWGNITISGGTVIATGGTNGAGIGGGRKSSVGSSVSCGNIIISGGTVTATGGEEAAGIGGGRGYDNSRKSSCGTITITSGVTEVTATKGSGATNSIGAGNVGTCGTVTIEDPSKVTEN